MSESSGTDEAGADRSVPKNTEAAPACRHSVDFAAVLGSNKHPTLTDKLENAAQILQAG